MSAIYCTPRSSYWRLDVCNILYTQVFLFKYRWLERDILYTRVFLFTYRCLQYIVHALRFSYLRTDVCNILYTQVFLFTPRCLQYTVNQGLPIYAQISAIYCTPRSSYLRTDGWPVIYCTRVSSYLRTFGRHMLYTRLPIDAHMSAICCTHHSFYNVHIVARYCTDTDTS